MATRRPTEPPTEKTAAPTPTPTTLPKPTRARAKSASPAPRIRKTAKTAATPVAVSEDVRRGMIAKAAYLRAERRGFAPGGEHEDWVAAEAEVDALLKAGHDGTSQ
jgi:Protein of unknown function (DUF2934)